MWTCLQASRAKWRALSRHGGLTGVRLRAKPPPKRWVMSGFGERHTATTALRLPCRSITVICPATSVVPRRVGPPPMRRSSCSTRSSARRRSTSSSSSSERCRLRPPMLGGRSSTPSTDARRKRNRRQRGGSVAASHTLHADALQRPGIDGRRYGDARCPASNDRQAAGIGGPASRSGGPVSRKGRPARDPPRRGEPLGLRRRRPPRRNVEGHEKSTLSPCTSS